MRRQETADLSPQRGPPQVSHLKPTMGVISVSKLIQTFISTTTIWLKSRMTWRGIWLKLRLRLREDKKVGGWVLVICIGWVGVAGNWPALIDQLWSQLQMHISAVSNMSSVRRSFIALHGIVLEDSSRILDDFLEVKRVIVRKSVWNSTTWAHKWNLLGWWTVLLKWKLWVEGRATRYCMLCGRVGTLVGSGRSRDSRSCWWGECL